MLAEDHSTAHANGSICSILPLTLRLNAAAAAQVVGAADHGGLLPGIHHPGGGLHAQELPAALRRRR